MSLVYNNKKLIGKCSKFSIEKVQGTSPFVMLENFDPKQPQLNENQQIVLEWLKNYYKENRPFTTAFGAIRNIASKRWGFIKQNLTEDQQEYVLEVFSKWAQEQEEE